MEPFTTFTHLLGYPVKGIKVNGSVIDFPGFLTLISEISLGVGILIMSALAFFPKLCFMFSNPNNFAAFLEQASIKVSPLKYI